MGFRGGRIFEGGHLLTFWTFMMGAYSRWALIRRWAVNQINTVVTRGFCSLQRSMPGAQCIKLVESHNVHKIPS